jgi:uncharacterized protein
MAEHPHIKVLRQAMQALAEGNLYACSNCWTSDFVLRFPGDHPLAGEYRGPEAAEQAISRLREETNGTLRWEPQQTFAYGRGRVIGTRRLTGERGGQRFDAVGAVIATVVGDRLASVEVFEQDLDAANQFWS